MCDIAAQGFFNIVQHSAAAPTKPDNPCSCHPTTDAEVAGQYIPQSPGQSPVILRRQNHFRRAFRNQTTRRPLQSCHGAFTFRRRRARPSSTLPDQLLFQQTRRWTSPALTRTCAMDIYTGEIVVTVGIHMVKPSRRRALQPRNLPADNALGRSRIAMIANRNLRLNEPDAQVRLA